MWFRLTGDERLGRCATDGCGGQPTSRLEADGVGSNYCSGCREKIEKQDLPKLLPCPFCGTGGSFVEPIMNDYGRWQIACGCCGMHAGNRPDNDLLKQAEHWNTRRS